MSTVPGGLSVVMPVYNKKPHINRSIESILAQNGGFEELIIIDDGSTDGGLERIRAYADPRIQVYLRSPPGPGGYAARNLGIRHASGEWIAFLDADDAWHPNFTDAIASLVEKADERIGCVFTSYEIDLGSSIIRQRYGARKSDAGIHRLGFAAFLENWITDGDPPIWTGAAVFRRRVLIGAGLFPEGRCRRGGDKDLWLRATARAEALCDPRIFVTYHRDSVNMVTRTVGTNTKHCICDTIVRLLPQTSPETAKLLMRLYNAEVYTYATSAFRSGGLSRKTFEGFFARYGFVRYALLNLLAILPPATVAYAKKTRRTLRGIGL
jgi:glycosyltransferase involved in cell wall biosynthesis